MHTPRPAPPAPLFACTVAARWARQAALALALACAAGLVGAAPHVPTACSMQLLGHGAGPYDYTGAQGPVTGVERHHFTPRVEALIGGESARSPGPDIDFILHRVPNHHRALLALVRLSTKLKSEAIPEMSYPVACYFERALSFRPNETVVRVVYAGYLGRVGQPKAAARQLEIATEWAKDNPLTHYNIGSTYLELKDFDRALAHARLAYAQGVTLPELRDKLKAAGRWSDADALPVPAPQPTAATAASATSAPAVSSVTIE